MNEAVMKTFEFDNAKIVDRLNLVDCGIRMVRKAGKRWFVLKDLLDFFGYTEGYNPPHVSDDCKTTFSFLTPGGNQDLLCLSDDGVVYFIGRSDKKKSIPFQMEICESKVEQTHSVDPVVPVKTIHELLMEIAKILVLNEKCFSEIKQRFFDLETRIVGLAEQVTPVVIVKEGQNVKA